MSPGIELVLRLRLRTFAKQDVLVAIVASVKATVRRRPSIGSKLPCGTSGVRTVREGQLGVRNDGFSTVMCSYGCFFSYKFRMKLHEIAISNCIYNCIFFDP